MRDHAGRAGWCAEGEFVNVTHQRNVKQFADTIGTFALRKQVAGARTDG
jgi:hypothetical protein